jgi:hypothetical protein
VFAAESVCKYIGIVVDPDQLTKRIDEQGVSEAERNSPAFHALVHSYIEESTNRMSKNRMESCYMALSAYGPLGTTAQGVLQTKR